MPYADRQAITGQNRNALIQFLSWERAVNLDILATVIQRHPNQTSRILKSMAKAQLVHCATVDFWGTRRTVWGLAPAGVALATTLVRPYENPDRIEVFKSSNLTPNSANHRRGIQQIRATHLESTAYLHSSQSGFRSDSWGKSKPDLLWNYRGQWYAIEYEETPKSLRRYVDIVETYFESMKSSKRLAGLIVCAQLKDIQGIRNLLSRAALALEIKRPPVWTCIAGQPLDSAIEIECRMPEVDQFPAAPASGAFVVGDLFYFAGDLEETEDHGYRPCGDFRVIAFEESTLIAVSDEAYQIGLQTHFGGFEQWYFEPHEVIKK